MVTYQDYLMIGDSDKERMEFVKKVINDYKGSELYRDALVAYDYFCKKNTTITNYQKMLNNLYGQKVIDKWSPNHKVVSGFFKRFVTQQTQFLLGNGISWDKETALDDSFDIVLQKIAKQSLWGAVSYGFWNLDKMTDFSALEFAPLYDEETSALRAGVRWWQIDANKPLRATFYEEDGYTEYIWNQRVENGETKTDGQVLREKRGYVMNTVHTDVDGTEIVGYTNYASFPIVPLWGNEEHQNELTGIRAGIDEYDLLKNGFANDLDNAMIYWVIEGAGGMDDPDLAQFLERLRLTGAVAPAEGQKVSAVPVQIPYEARDTLLNRVEHDLYRDYMALNTEELSSRNATATEIKAAYEPMNAKADDFEYQILEFLNRIMELAGIDAKPTFTRSYIVNAQEEVTTVLSAASYTGAEYTTQKVLTILGDGDKADEIIKAQDADEIDKIGETETEEPTEEEER